MNHLIFYTATNSILKVQRNPFKIYFKKDAKYVFIPEAKAFADFHKDNSEYIVLFSIDCTRKNPVQKRMEQILAEIEEWVKIDSVSFFCHGWPKGIQFGFKGKEGASILGNALDEKGVDHINLYACYCAKHKKDGCFAEWLAEAANAPVYGHFSKGHATFNPNVNKCYWYFDLSSNMRKVLNNPIIKRKTPLWPLWRKELKESETFRFEFPYMEIEEVKKRLLTGN